MTPAAIAAKVAYGYGKAASKLGQTHSLYRPTSPTVPALDPGNLLVWAMPFISSATAKGDFAAPSKYGTAIRYALVDASAIQSGDYVQGPTGTFFVASLNPLEIPMVVECNAVVTVKRPAGQDDDTDLSPGRHGYEGPTAANDRVILLSWPASVLDGGRTEASRPDLPGDVAAKGMVILLPATPNCTIRTMDRIEDGRQAYTVSSAELTALGWRLGASFSEGL